MLNVLNILIVYAVTNVVLTVVVAILWVQNRTHFDGIHLWVARFILLSTGVGLIALRHLIPVFFSVVVANAFIAVSSLLLYLGCERFIGRPSRQRYNYLILGVFVLVFALCTYVWPSVNVRIALISAVTMVFISQCAWFLLFTVPLELRRIAAGTGIVCVLLALTQFARLFFALVTPELGDYLNAPILDTGAQLANLVLAIAVTFALISMVNRRSLDIIQEKEREIVETRIRAEVDKRENEELKRVSQALRVNNAQLYEERREAEEANRIFKTISDNAVYGKADEDGGPSYCRHDAERPFRAN